MPTRRRRSMYASREPLKFDGAAQASTFRVARPTAREKRFETLQVSNQRLGTSRSTCCCAAAGRGRGLSQAASASCGALLRADRVEIFLDVAVTAAGGLRRVGGIAWIQAVTRFPRVRKSVLVGVRRDRTRFEDGPAADFLLRIDQFAAAGAD